MRSVIKLVTLELSTQWRAWMGGNVSAQARVRELVQIYEDRGNFRPLSQFCCFSYAYLGGYVCVCVYICVCVYKKPCAGCVLMFVRLGVIPPY